MLCGEGAAFSTVLTGFHFITPCAFTGRPVGTLG